MLRSLSKGGTPVLPNPSQTCYLKRGDVVTTLHKKQVVPVNDAMADIMHWGGHLLLGE